MSTVNSVGRWPLANVELQSDVVRGMRQRACPDIATYAGNSRWSPTFGRRDGVPLEGGFFGQREFVGSGTACRLRLFRQASTPLAAQLTNRPQCLSSRYHSFYSLSQDFLAAHAATFSRNRAFSSSSEPDVPTAGEFAKHLSDLELPELIEGLQAYDGGQMQQSYRGFRRLRETLEHADEQSVEHSAKTLVLGCMYTALFRVGEYREARRFAADARDLSRAGHQSLAADTATVCDIRAALEEAKTARGKGGVAEWLLQRPLWPSADDAPERPSRLEELRILQTSLAVYKRGAGEADIGKSWETRENGGKGATVGLPASFLGLMKEYNDFILKYFARGAEPTPSDPRDDPAEVLLAVERMAKEASSLLKQNEAFLTGALSIAERSPSTVSETGGAGCIAERITKRELGAELVRGIALLHEGLGTVLVKQSNGVESECDRTTDELRVLGDKVLKDGLTICKKYAHIDTKNILASLLSALATSFKQRHEPVISEGLFRSSLNEFNTAAGLNVQLVSVPIVAAGDDSARIGGESRVAYPRQATLDAIVSFGVALLQYSALLNKWDGREVEAEMICRPANQILESFGLPTSKDPLENVPARLHVLPLLWKPSVCLARPLLVYVKEREAVSGGGA
ncbi:hypothetical protein TGRUB_315230 [Toxoplasma gondii RUB]|uniref:Uncharacterized protein n=1 Tax=Toxoplasma gondii RUB TaxID=935652 RepID=A0A086MBR4_TOXGO|nr:hypothetical protein TGRUB_315230 [Toxoplasma gondii RUB]